MSEFVNLEFNLVRHCNYSCRSCNHFSPVAKRWFMDPLELERDLAVLTRVAHWSFGCAQGGEPTLHPKLIEFLEIIHRSGIADKVGMLTNGSLLDRLPDEFWKTAAKVGLELRCSVYGKLPPHMLPYATEKAKEYGVDFRPGNVAAFKPMFTRNKDGGRKVWAICPWKRCWTLHCGYLYHCPIAAFLPVDFPEKFADRVDPLVDGYPVATLTHEVLSEMLTRKHPLKSCEVCTGAVVGDWVPWAEIREGREAWINATTV